MSGRASLVAACSSATTARREATREMLLWITCCCALLWLFWRALHHYRLPRLPEQKLTRELLQHALLECTSPLVRLPGTYGVLVTEPRLARKLLEGGHGAVRDVSEYTRYRGFLDRSLVLLPQATAEHATVCRSATTALEIEPRTSGPQTKARATVRTRVSVTVTVSVSVRCEGWVGYSRAWASPGQLRAALQPLP